MADPCVFCKIIAGEISSPKLYEDDSVICIRDINPHARQHFLVIPKKHIGSLNEAFPENSKGDTELIGQLVSVGVQMARQYGIAQSGYRTVFNTGKDGTQTVFHVHLHVLGGEPLRGTLK